MLWDVAQLKANGQTEEAWSRLKELAKLAKGLGGQPGMVIESGALWGSLQTLSNELGFANGADEFDPLMQAKKELREASEDQQVRARRALNAYRNYLLGDTEAWDNLSPEDRAAADELYGSTLDPLAALGGPLLMGGTRSPPKGKQQKPAGGGDDPAPRPAAPESELGGAAEAGGGETVMYRGISENHPGYKNALLGIAEPRWGVATPEQHVLGDTQSMFTSWTLDVNVAKNFATFDEDIFAPTAGVYLAKTFSNSDLVVPAKGFASESERLVYGPITGATVTKVPFP
jgi:hypothetical protein